MTKSLLAFPELPPKRTKNTSLHQKQRVNSESLPRTGRLGGIDFGTVRIGIAVCDPSQHWVTPLETYQRRRTELDAAFFQDLVAREALVGWVIGLPIHCDGKESQKSKQVREFAAWLQTVTSLPFACYDERFTTREARRLLQGSDISSAKKKQKLDQIAAHLILTHFLDSTRHSEGSQLDG